MRNIQKYLLGIKKGLEKACRTVRRTAKQQIAAVSVLSVAMSMVMGVMLSSMNNVIIRDEDDYQIVRTFRTDLNDIIEQANVTLSAYDEIKETDNPAFYKDITILRAFPASITCDGEKTTYQLTSGTVQTLLDLKGITLNENDTISDSAYVPLESGINVVIHRVLYETQIIDTAIPYDTCKVPVETIPRGKTKLVTAGVEGVSRSIVETKLVDGTAVEQNVVDTQILSQPVSETVNVGVGTVIQTSRGESIRSSYYIDMTATAYTYGDGGSWGDITYSGKAVKVGYVAVDPRVIPLGSRLYITYPNGKSAYGYAVAEDTGGSIKGKRIDLFMNSYDQCINFGIRKVRVYVLD